MRLPFQIVDPILKQLKQEQLVAFKGAAEMGDYDFVITELGRERARRYLEECTYFGSAPVTLPDYLQAMAAQTIAKQQATEEDLKRAFADLVVPPRMLDRLGPAINSGRGMFLFGIPATAKRASPSGSRGRSARRSGFRGPGHRRRHHSPVRPGHSRCRRIGGRRRHLESRPASTTAGSKSRGRRSRPAAN